MEDYRSALRAGDGAFDEDEVLIREDAKDLQALDRHAAATIAATHTHALEYAGWVGSGTNGTGSALAVMLTVRSIVHTFKVVTLYYTLKAFTLGGTDGGASIAFYEYFVDGDGLTKCFGEVHIPELDYFAFGRGVSGREVALELLTYFALVTLAVGKLQGAVCIRIVGFHLRNYARAGFDYGTGDVAACLVEDGGHPDFFTNNTVHWS